MRILFLCRNLFRFELEHGKMENKIVSRSLRKQLNQITIHEQVENGVVINRKMQRRKFDNL